MEFNSAFKGLKTKRNLLYI